MNYRLFIDDERFPVTPNWFIARNSFQAIMALELYGIPQEIAFDHDLGGQDTSITFIICDERAVFLAHGNNFPIRYINLYFDKNELKVEQTDSIDEINHLSLLDENLDQSERYLRIP